MTGSDVSVNMAAVNRLAVDLSRAASRAIGEIEPVMKRAAQNIKNDLVADASASRHFHGLVPSISYDRTGFASTVGYEIGPDKDRRGGALGNIAYYGTSRGGGSLDLEAPLAAEEPRLVAALADVLRDVL